MESEFQTVKKYERRFEKGYDVEDKDKQYKVWLQFKNLSLILEVKSHTC